MDVGDEREDVGDARAVRVAHHREPEVGRQPVGDLGPRRPAVVAAVDAAVVLQEQLLRPAGMAGDLVHAVAELRVLLALGEEPGADAGVRRLPALAAVARAVHAGGRDRR